MQIEFKLNSFFSNQSLEFENGCDFEARIALVGMKGVGKNSLINVRNQ